MREVRISDFYRKEIPEYAKTDDYEFRNDGKLVRKDRWERAIFSIASKIGMNVRNFEIEDVVNRVREVMDIEFSNDKNNEWQPIETAPRKEYEDFIVFNGKVRHGQFWEGYWLDSTHCFMEPQPTHWMPLPPPPK